MLTREQRARAVWDEIEAGLAAKGLVVVPKSKIERLAEAERLLRDCDEYFDGRADAEFFPNSPSAYPNEEMRYLSEIRAFLAKGDKP